MKKHRNKKKKRNSGERTREVEKSTRRAPTRCLHGWKVDDLVMIWFWSCLASVNGSILDSLTHSLDLSADVTCRDICIRTLMKTESEHRNSLTHLAWPIMLRFQIRKLPELHVYQVWRHFDVARQKPKDFVVCLDPDPDKTCMCF